jgi:hypothetical protein
MTQEVKPRVEALREAARIISGDRDVQYGGPEENFERIAKIWGVILSVDITREDVAMMMVGLKVARYASKSGFQPDTWIDVAGYAGCGFEVGQLESQNNAETASPIHP